MKEDETFLIEENKKKELLEIRDTFYKTAKFIFSIVPSEKGIIEFHDRRLVLLNTSTFSKIHESLERVLGAPMRKQLLFKFGEKAGKDIANMFLHVSKTEILKLIIKTHFDLKTLEKLKGNTSLEIAHKILGYGKYAGWIGNSEITHFSEKPPYARIIVSNSFESYALKNNSPSQPVCNFFSGVVNGIMKVILNNDHVATEEVSCAALGNEYCEFIVRGAENGNK